MTTSQARADLESLYGSSFYGGVGGHLTDDIDLPEYTQMCRRLFPTLLGTNDNDDLVEPETEESIARYFKYLTDLPLPSLKMEPVLLQGDLQRITNDLTTLLLNESFQSLSGAETDMSAEKKQGGLEKPVAEDSFTAAPVLASQAAEGGDVAGRPVFGVINDMNNLGVSVCQGLNEELVHMQDTLGRLEEACAVFAADMSVLDQRAKVVQHVLDKQDLIARIVELPRVMQMCVAGGYYEEAVDIAKHVQATGDRLIKDIEEDVQTINGSRNGIQAQPESKDELVAFVSAIQKQVQSEYEAMILGLCRELSYTRPASTATGVSPPLHQQTGDRSVFDLRPDGDSLGDSNLGGHERSMKRMAQMSKVVSILRNVGSFTETQLRMLYLRSRWQAWIATAESLHAFAPAIEIATGGDSSSDGTRTPNITLLDPSLLLFSDVPSVFQSLPVKELPKRKLHNPRHKQQAKAGASSAEVAAYLGKYIDGFFLWLAEVNMQYQMLFPTTTVTTKSTENSAGTAKTSMRDPFMDLVVFSSQQFVAAVTPLLPLLTDAPGISTLLSLVTKHSRILSQSNIDFATPFLEEALRERAFSSIVNGVEASVESACQSVSMLAETAKSKRRGSVEHDERQKWDQLAAPTRPPPLDLHLELSLDNVEDAQKFLSQLRISPVGLLQYPLLAQLLHSFRDSLHALRIVVLAADSAEYGEVVVLLNMVSVVLECELVRVTEALGALWSSRVKGGDEKSRRVFRDVCVAFVFGLARHVAEIFEEVATLNDASASVTGVLAAGELSMALYSTDIYKPLLEHIVAEAGSQS
ncbi:hypothetical protein GGI07_001408 [Coemansia sp. Benny D115]|nr:hypothetical protein GGI07_001408 [Coemansia sp. Benny D115]